MSEQEPLDLKAIEGRLSKVTGNKWRWFVDEVTHHVTFMADDFLVMDFPPGTFGGYRPYEEDREFIANAPTDIAALVAEVKRLRAGLSTIANWYEDSGDMYEEIMMPHVVKFSELVLENNTELVNQFLATKNTKLLE